MLKKFYNAFLLGVFIITPYLYSEDFEDFDFDNLESLEEALDSIPDKIINQTSRHINLGPDQIQDCIEILTDDEVGINTIPILKVPLYLKTYPLHQRNVLDLPFFNLFLTCPSDDSVVRLDAFYNHMPRSYFTAGSTNIRDYIALEDENLIRAIEDAEQKIRETFGNFDLSIPVILSLFSCMTIEERRVGLMFQYMKTIDCFQFIAKVPFLWNEHNFFLTDAEICTIQNQKIPGLGTSETGQPQGNTKRQLERLLTRDVIQFGDFRLDISYALNSSPTRQSYLGLEFTFPTHFNLKNGIIGRPHRRCCMNPNLDLCEIIQLGINGGQEDQQIATDKVSAFFIGALEQLSSNVLDPNPYNDGRHITIGVYSNSCIRLCDWLTVRSKSSVSFVTKNKESRYYIPVRNPKQFNRDFEDTSNPENNKENLEFINEKFNEKFYPQLVPTVVRPGIIVQLTNHAHFTWWNWGIAVGGDLWWQSQEDIVCNNCMHELDLQKGVQPEAFQTKLSGLVTYRKEKCDTLWHIFGGLEATTMSSGIGKDFTLTLGFEVAY
jgi:hypothetical protein